jgi:SAM-dependent methyltransferase
VFDPDFLREIRLAELESALPDFPGSARVLDVGAGDGTQARELSRRGHDVVAVDLARSAHAARRVFPVVDFDGIHLPLPDASVDVVYSSNVLEHVADLPALLAETRRVTRAGGLGIHVMPSVAWRLWTLATGPPTSAVAIASLFAAVASRRRARDAGRERRLARIAVTALLPIAHGASGNALTEIVRFRAGRWRRTFGANGFEVVRSRRTNLFHTGHMLLGARLPLPRRTGLADRLGSAAHLFVVRPTCGRAAPLGSARPLAQPPPLDSLASPRPSAETRKVAARSEPSEER